MGFNTSKKNHLLYKNRDARPLILSMIGYTYNEDKPIIVRKAECRSIYCLNPSHYYWGTRKDVAYENAKRNNIGINNELITKLRIEKAEGISSLKLAKAYKLPYHTVRRICNNETYEEITEQRKQNPFDEKVANALANGEVEMSIKKNIQ